jgi:hypothetical protein
VSWNEPQSPTPERVAEQMSRAEYRDGVWYRREGGKLVVWPVLKLDRLGVQAARAAEGFYGLPAPGDTEALKRGGFTSRIHVVPPSFRADAQAYQR